MNVLFDHSRRERIGLPETVYCQGKPLETLIHLIREQAKPEASPLLFTRLAPDVFERLPEDAKEALDYHALSGTAYGGVLPPRPRGRVAVVSAGTCDGAVAWEAARTLVYLGIAHTLYEDSGVAGLWRLATRLEEINAHDVIIIAAGMDAALATVLGGLTPRPVVAVPTSVGYGVASGGNTALAAMLSSCAPGVCVQNIDNGYGAACAAARIVGLCNG
jgi:pyridinium-3,5-biscarboxylic acid mononucleotide synthase